MKEKKNLNHIENKLTSAESALSEMETEIRK